MGALNKNFQITSHASDHSEKWDSLPIVGKIKINMSYLERNLTICVKSLKVRITFYALILKNYSKIIRVNTKDYIDDFHHYIISNMKML
jgi:hypothetical protein